MSDKLNAFKWSGEKITISVYFTPHFVKTAAVLIPQTMETRGSSYPGFVQS